MCIFRATVSAVSCLVVPVFICIDLFLSCALKLNDDDDDVRCMECAFVRNTDIILVTHQTQLSLVRFKSLMTVDFLSFFNNV